MPWISIAWNRKWFFWLWREYLLYCLYILFVYDIDICVSMCIHWDYFCALFIRFIYIAHAKHKGPPDNMEKGNKRPIAKLNQAANTIRIKSNHVVSLGQLLQKLPEYCMPSLCIRCCKIDRKQANCVVSSCCRESLYCCHSMECDHFSNMYTLCLQL